MKQITRDLSLVVCLLLWWGVSGVGVFLLLRVWLWFVGFSMAQFSMKCPVGLFCALVR